MANEVAKTTTPASSLIELGNQVKEMTKGLLSEEEAMSVVFLFQSGYYTDLQSISQTITRVVIGKQMGIGAIQAINNIYITPNGKIAMDSAMIRAVANRSGYKMRPITMENDRCVIEWSHNGEVLGTSEFNKEDAVIAGFVDPLCTEWPVKHNIRKISKYNKYKKKYEEIETCECKDNYKKHPKDMLLARATTRGARMFADAAFGDQAVYDKEEIEDVGIALSNNAPDATGDAEKPKKEVKTYAQAPEAETVSKPSEGAEKANSKRERPIIKGGETIYPTSEPPEDVVPPEPSPRNQAPKESSEKVANEDELEATRLSIMLAGDLMDIKEADLKKIYKEVSGKEDLDTITDQMELDTIYSYLEEMNNQGGNRVPKKSKDAEEVPTKQASLDDIKGIFPDAEDVTPDKR